MDHLKIQFDNDRKIVKEWKASKPQHVKDAERRIQTFQKVFRSIVNPFLKKNRKEKRIEIVKRKVHLFDGIEYEKTANNKIQLQTVFNNIAFGTTLIEPQKATNRIDIR
tara:strand:- start:1113 stop:1439 length:327 start_codon:yes stop_codon:yes gene_type:complete